jgi:anti-sigma factor ChrR (cupin superfamily)
MTLEPGTTKCDALESTTAYALGALPAAEVAAVEAHLAECPACRAELESLRSVVGTFSWWPADELQPSATLWDRLMGRIGVEPAADSASTSAPLDFPEPQWEQVAPGIACKLLATDTVNDRVSMLVRLSPGAAYPPHTHAGVEELHLLDGELYIEDRKLLPGDFNRAEPGTGDKLVWSETGCTCVLITSTRDRLAG